MSLLSTFSRNVLSLISPVIVFTILLTQNINAQTSLRYMGSSTVGNFMEEASKVYAPNQFDINTEHESAGGELAIVEGRADLAGVANVPSAQTMGRGVVSTLIGWDAIAVIVAESNPVNNLTQSQLKDIFTGRITNWKEVGGPDLAIKPYIVSHESATRNVFRSAILGQDDYAGCEVAVPDMEIVKKVMSDPGAIGHISFSFIKNESQIKKLEVNGQALSLFNASYPITRPLYLLWWPGRQEVASFIDWTLSPEGQRVVMQNFIGVREATANISQKPGTLVVITETYPVEDGGTFYYPHKPYEVYTKERKLIMRVPNHLSPNDESPTRVHLNPGSYLVRTTTGPTSGSEYFVVVESDKLTKLNVADNSKVTAGKQRDGEANMPMDADWIAGELAHLDRLKSFQPYGDFRLRAAGDFRESGDRFRMRFRLRAGVGVKISPSMKMDFRLISTDDPEDPNSPHADFSRGFNNVHMMIDRAYFYVNPQRLDYMKLWLGKFPNPLTNAGVFSELTWDADLNPEGMAMALDFSHLPNQRNLRLVHGTYLLSNIQTGTERSLLNSGQVSFGFPLSKKATVSLNSSYFLFGNIKDREITNITFDPNAGNATYQQMHIGGSDTTYTTHFLSDFSVLENFVLVKFNHLPKTLELKGEYIHNFGADSQNQGYAIGFSYGDLDDLNDWRIFYQYQYLQQESVFSPFVQDDFMRQTDFEGHVFGLAYAFHKKVSLQLWMLLDKPISADGGNRSRVRLDLNVKL